LGLGWLRRASLPRRLHEPNGGKSLSQQDISKARNPDTRASLAAMHRAAAMARKIAIDTDTEIIIVRDGKPVRISAKQLREGAE
jgi:hypothetical protein